VPQPTGQELLEQTACDSAAWEIGLISEHLEAGDLRLQGETSGGFAIDGENMNPQAAMKERRQNQQYRHWGFEEMNRWRDQSSGSGKW
jgi:hypothetical protein